MQTKPVAPYLPGADEKQLADLKTEVEHISAQVLEHTKTCLGPLCQSYGLSGELAIHVATAAMASAMGQLLGQYLKTEEIQPAIDEAARFASYAGAVTDAFAKANHERRSTTITVH